MQMDSRLSAYCHSNTDFPNVWERCPAPCLSLCDNHICHQGLFLKSAFSNTMMQDKHRQGHMMCGGSKKTKPMQVYNAGIGNVCKPRKVLAHVGRHNVYSILAAERGKIHTCFSRSKSDACLHQAGGEITYSACTHKCP